MSVGAPPALDECAAGSLGRAGQGPSILSFQGDLARVRLVSGLILAAKLRSGTAVDIA